MKKLFLIKHVINANKFIYNQQKYVHINGKYLTTTQINSNKPGNDNNSIINLNDLNNTSLKRKELGFEQESLLDSDWKEIRIDHKKLVSFYSKLSKRNLTALVVTTTMMGCAMAPMPFDPYIFLYATLGTTLTSSSANAFNQYLEVPYDSQMNRTKDRVLVRGNVCIFFLRLFFGCISYCIS